MVKDWVWGVGERGVIGRGVWLVGLMLLLVLGPAARWTRLAAAEAPLYVFDVRGNEALVLLPEGELARRGPGGVEGLAVQALSARYLPDGGAAVVDDEFALWRLDEAGRHAWLPPGSANAPLFVSPDGKWLAYLKPLELAPGAEFPLGNAVAVREIAGGEERVLLAVEGVTVQLFGWVGDELAVRVPNWSLSADGKMIAPDKALILAQLRTAGPNTPRAMAALPAVAPGSHFPQTSFNQRLLAYTSADGVVVADLATGEHAVYAGRETPWWTEIGLTALTAADRAPLGWQRAHFGPAVAASGPVALPQATIDPGTGSGAAPEAAGSILFYRPVPEFVGARQIRVSAYYDLDPDVGEIADWLGWVGSTWIYGRAYDQHRGTDYDGITGDAVYISAPGTVYQVTVDCNNYYPGGPLSFGTAVRLNHGVMADGNTYYTIYGHLKCDGVQTITGTVYTSLPSQIGLMGNTGYSTGDHLHLEVRRNSQTNPVDPYSQGIIGGFPPPMSTIGDVQGTVREPGGAPAAGARIKFFYDGQYYTALTGFNGAYRFDGLDVGAVTITAARGARYGSVNGTVAGGVLTTLPDLVLSQCAGTITGADGCPVRTFDGAIYIADVTVPDPAVYAPNVPLTKTWRLRNTGTTTWGAGYQLVFIAGDQRGAPLAIDAPSTPPGAEADLTTVMNAPAEIGMRRGYWRMRNPQGVYFGSTVWVEVNTAPVSNYIALGANPPSPSAAGTVQVTATVTAMPGYRAMRLLIDGVVVTETTSTSLNYAWNTTGYGAVEHSLTIQAATNADPAWAQPEQRGTIYRLLSGSAATIIESGAAAPTCAVQALPGSQPTPAFTVGWSGAGGTGGIATYEVQFQDTGRGPWRTWLSQTAVTSATFTGQTGHRYAFRCRATDGTNQTGSFPGVGDTETTVGTDGGAADLRVVSLAASPNPAGGLWARLTIENEGATSTGRGFHADLYLNDPPSGPGDYGGSVNIWVNEPLAAGATRTLEAQVTQGSGEISATLYALVDSAGVITEADEGDNAYLAGVTNCLAAEDAYEDDSGPATAKALNPGASQAHTIGGPGDEDWMLLGVTYGTFYWLNTSGLAAGLDTRLRIVDPDGQSVMAVNDDLSATDLSSRLGWTPPAPGTYYAVVDSWHPATGGCGAGYTVSLAAAGPGWVVFFPMIYR